MDYELSTPTTATKQQIWERKLLDFTLRNNLLNTRLGRRVVPFISQGIHHLEDHLQMGEDYRVMPCPTAKIEPGADGMYDSTRQGADLRKEVEEAMEGRRLLSYLTETELANALKYVYRTARTALEENGANSLFLSLGMLRWYEDERSDKAHYAPILLLPVDIVRKGGGNYVIRKRDEDIMLNITLSELLRQNYQLSLDALRELPHDQSGVDVKAIFNTVRKAVASQQRWTVVEEALLGLFSFNKFVMWNDIHTNASLLQESGIVASLIEGRNKLGEPPVPVDARQIDRDSAPKDFAVPLDVDSSQMEAIVESGRGQSFILHGPPGTGKSQTITNMIANALYQGRRVLFVAEKMAALSVVQARLEKIGLAPFCLELHSNKATKRHFLEQMDAVLNVKRIHPPKEFSPASDELLTERHALAAYMEALHQRSVATGLSLYECISGFLSIAGDEMPPDALPPQERLTRDLTDRCRASVEQMEAVTRVVGHPESHPLRGLEPTDNRLETIESLKKVLSDISHANKSYQQQTEAISSRLPFRLSTETDVQWVERFAEIIATEKDCDERREALLKRYSDDVLRLDPDASRREWDDICQRWFLPRYFAKKKFVKELQRYGTVYEADVEPLITQVDEYQQQQQALATKESELVVWCHDQRIRHQERRDAFNATVGANASERLNSGIPTLGGVGSYSRQEFMLDAKALTTTYRHLLSLMDEYHSLTTGHQTLGQLLSLTDGWLAAYDRLRDWFLWVELRRKMEADGLTAVAVAVESDGAEPSAAADAFLKAAYHRLATLTIDGNPSLRMFNGLVFRQQIEKYKRDARRFQELSKAELYSRLASRVPSVATAQADGSEVSILKRNIASGGRGNSIRSIIDNIPTLLPRLCPCMLMSPISVAQYIDLKAPKFDLVIFDEASQMPTSEAVGAIARGKALIVVGDSRQMPPTSFFTTTQVDEEEADIDDMESILDDCKTLSMREYYLTWHYRSRHESLIAFSNSQYYDGRLLTFPSVDDQTPRVRLVKVEGQYDKGRSRVNPEESRQIVEEVMRRLADPELRKRSIGVVSFSKVQGDRIEDDLTEQLDRHPELKEVALGGPEPVFVKNLENVQGDERDVILFSVGYGPDQEGRLSMNFGPLNNSGGERRLNVAVSRARYEMIVFSTMQASQIDLRRSSAKGVEGLKGFLEFAETGIMPPTGTTTPPMEQSQIVGELCDAINKYGYVATPGVGRSNFKVDVAVATAEHPDRYVLGILCDGRSYYETKTTRDREIVQPTVLQQLGWRTMRVYSVDWYDHRDQVLQNILDELSASTAPSGPSAGPVASIGSPARKAAPVGSHSGPVASGGSPARTSEKPSYVFDINRLKAIDPAESTIRNAGQVAYTEATVSLPPFDKNAYQPTAPYNTSALRQILSVEQPASEAWLCKRLAKAIGFSHVSTNIQKAVDLSQKVFYVDPMVVDGQRTFWLSKDDAKGYTYYRASSPRTIAEIPAPEIANVITEALREEFSLPPDRVPQVVARKLGFASTGPKIAETVTAVLNYLIHSGKVAQSQGVVSLSSITRME